MRNKSVLPSARLLSAVLFSTLLVGCISMAPPPPPSEPSPPPPPPPPAPAPAPAVAPIPVHAWSYLTRYGAEPDNYAAYTYVLTGRTDSDSESAVRFQKLVDAVKNTTLPLEYLPSARSRETNIFLVPAQPESETPSPTLAKAYVTALESSHESLRNPGPFLVVVYEPLSSPRNEIKNILIVDLSRTHEDAYEEIVGVLKARLGDDTISGVETLRSFKASLLSFALVTNDALNFAPVVYKEVLAFFGPQ